MPSGSVRSFECDPSARSRYEVVGGAFDQRAVDLEDVGVHFAQEIETASARAGVVHRDFTTTIDE